MSQPSGPGPDNPPPPPGPGRDMTHPEPQPPTGPETPRPPIPMSNQGRRDYYMRQMTGGYSEGVWNDAHYLTARQRRRMRHKANRASMRQHMAERAS